MVEVIIQDPVLHPKPQTLNPKLCLFILALGVSSLGDRAQSRFCEHPVTFRALCLGVQGLGLEADRKIDRYIHAGMHAYIHT